MLFHAGPTMRFLSTDRAVVRTLRSRIAAGRETRGIVVLCAPQEVFLLEAKPKIIVVVVDPCAAVACVGSAISVEDLRHDEIGILPPRIRENGDRLEQTVGIAAGRLLGAAAVE